MRSPHGPRRFLRNRFRAGSSDKDGGASLSVRSHSEVTRQMRSLDRLDSVLQNLKYGCGNLG